jgi:hypothetical protein
MRPSPLILVALGALAYATEVGVPPAVRGQNVAGPCPALSVSCPDTATLGMPTVFTVNISGGDDKVNPSFEWEASVGTITSGQGTSTVIVDTTGLPLVSRRQLTATVKVGGYSPSCQNKVSCTTEVIAIIDYFPMDEYGNLRWSDEKARLDNFAIELRGDTTWQGYLFCYGGRRGQRGEAARRCARAKNYLIAVRHIAPAKLVTVDGGYREDLTVVLWVRPPGLDIQPVPTVDPTEVKFTNATKKRRRRPGSKRD